MDGLLTADMFKKLLEAIPEPLKPYAILGGGLDKFNDDSANVLTINKIELLAKLINTPIRLNSKNYENLVLGIEAMLKSEEFVVVDELEDLIDVFPMLNGLKDIANQLAVASLYIAKNKYTLQSNIEKVFSTYSHDIILKIMLNPSDIFTQTELMLFEKNLLLDITSVESSINKIKERFVRKALMKAPLFEELTMVNFSKVYDIQKMDYEYVMDLGIETRADT